jgi:hypothetical protein
VCHAALSDEKQLRRNFPGSFSFEMIFTFGRGTPPERAHPIAAKRKARLSAGLRQLRQFEKSGAGEGIRTLDPDLGKVVLYH